MLKLKAVSALSCFLFRLLLGLEATGKSALTPLFWFMLKLIAVSTLLAPILGSAYISAAKGLFIIRFLLTVPPGTTTLVAGECGSPGKSSVLLSCDIC